MPDISRIPRNPAEWTYEHASSAAAYPKPEESVGDGLKYLQGDHFQDALPWLGPAGDKEDIRKRFVSVPESASRVATRVNGACGNEADISIQPREPQGTDGDGNPAPSEEQAKFADEWKRDIGARWTEWNLWGGRDLAKHPTGVRGMVAYASAGRTGSACLRAFLNPEARNAEGNIPRQRDRRAALSQIIVEAPPPDRCSVYTDPDTHRKTGVFLYTDDQQRSCAEVWYSVTEGEVRKTAMRQIVSGLAERASPFVFPWGGLLPVQQADIGSILTPSVCRSQAALDFAASALNRNMEAHGYGQRTEINPEQDGEWRNVAPPGPAVPRTQVVDGQTQYFWPKDPTLGAKTIRRLVGFPYTVSIDPETGKETTGITTPAVHYHEPSPPEAILTGMRAETAIIRDACHQGHITDNLLGSTAEASGDAYEQKRADFQADIQGVAETVDNTLAPFLTVVTLMADSLTGDESASFLSEWEVKVQSHPSAGPVSSAKEMGTIALKKEKIISAEEATARVGVQDVAGERQKIQAQRTAKERAEEAAPLIDQGADRMAAWIEAGFTEKRAKDFARTDGAPFVQQ